MNATPKLGIARGDPGSGPTPCLFRLNEDLVLGQARDSYIFMAHITLSTSESFLVPLSTIIASPRPALTPSS